MATRAILITERQFGCGTDRINIACRYLWYDFVLFFWFLQCIRYSDKYLYMVVQDVQCSLTMSCIFCFRFKLRTIYSQFRSGPKICSSRNSTQSQRYLRLCGACGHLFQVFWSTISFNPINHRVDGVKCDFNYNESNRVGALFICPQLQLNSTFKEWWQTSSHATFVSVLLHFCTTWCDSEWCKTQSNS